MPSARHAVAPQLHALEAPVERRSLVGDLERHASIALPPAIGSHPLLRGLVGGPANCRADLSGLPWRCSLRKSMRQIRAAMGAAVIDPSLLTFAEKLQYEGYLRREETNAAILSLSRQRIAIKEIVRRTGYSHRLIRKIIRGQRADVFRVRQSSLEPYLPWLDEQWEAGCRNGAALWRALQLRRFRGCLRIVSEWNGRRKKADKADPAALARPHPPATERHP